jgi:hypothetical protein
VCHGAQNGANDDAPLLRLSPASAAWLRDAMVIAPVHDFPASFQRSTIPLCRPPRVGSISRPNSLHEILIEGRRSHAPIAAPSQSPPGSACRICRRAYIAMAAQPIGAGALCVQSMGFAVTSTLEPSAMAAASGSTRMLYFAAGGMLPPSLEVKSQIFPRRPACGGDDAAPSGSTLSTPIFDQGLFREIGFASASCLAIVADRH